MAGAERLHGRFLGCEASGKVRCRIPAPPTVRDLAFSEDPLNESVAVTGDGSFDARNVGRVYPGADNVHVRMVLRVEGPAQGRENLLSFYWTDESWGAALRCTPLGTIAGHFFTTRHLALGASNGEEPDGWDRVADTAGVQPRSLRRVRQVHGAKAVLYRRPAATAIVDRPVGDVLASDDPTIALAVQVADCVPILMADPRTGAAAAVHAGWRGIAGGAVGAAVAALVDGFGAKAHDLVAALGPSIGPCCYQVGAELKEAFRTAGFSRADVDRWFSRHDDPPSGLRLDLWQASRDQLVAEGLDPAAIHAAGLCTFTRSDLFFSYRRDGTGAGRMAAVIRARP